MSSLSIAGCVLSARLWVLALLLCANLLASGGASAEIVADPARELGSLQYHRIHFNVPAEVMGAVTHAEVRARMEKVVDDLNVLFAHQTTQRFVFNAQTDVSFYNYYWPGAPISFNSLPMLKRSYEIDVQFNPTPGHASMSFETNGATLVDFTYGLIPDRDTPLPTGSDPVGWDKYWSDLMTLAHEILHGMGAGGAEYYRAADKMDSTGVAPDLSIALAYNAPGNAYFHQERSDYATDPLLTTERSSATIADRLLRTRFAELSAAHGNGRLRFNIFPTPSLVPDLSHTRIHITEPNGVTPVAGALVRVWGARGGNSAFVLRYSGTTAADGSIEFNWVPTSNQVEEPLLLIKVEPAGGAWPASGRWFSQQQAMEEFLLRGETQMHIHLALEASTPRPTLTQIAALQGQEDVPLTITHAALLAGSDASDPQGLPIQFRIERFAAGRLTKNGVPIAAHATLLGPGESLQWTPPRHRHDPDFPALVLRAHNGQSSSLNAVTVRVALAATPDLPRADNQAYTLAESGQITFELVVDDPDGGAVPALVQRSAPAHGQLTLAAEPDHYPIYTYRPDANYFGSDSFTYLARGSNGDSALATVQFTITPVDDLPLSSPSYLTPFAGTEDNPRDFSVGDLLTTVLALSLDGRPLSMRVTTLGTGTLTKAGVPVAANTLLAPSDTLHWQPAANSNGLQTAFSFVVDDGLTGTDVSTVQVNLAAVNDPPTFNLPTSASISEDGSACISMTGIGPGGGSDEASQVLSFALSSTNDSAIPDGAPYLQVTGGGSSRCLMLLSATNGNGTTVVAVSLIETGASPLSSLTRYITVTVNPVNDAPRYISGSGTFNSSGIFNWVRLFPNLSVTDADSGDSITCRFTGGLPNNVEITTASGSHTSVSGVGYYSLATFKSFWIVKRSVFSGGTETHTFSCKDASGAETGAISYTVVAS